MNLQYNMIEILKVTLSYFFIESEISNKIIYFEFEGFIVFHVM
jgi:hypothetical protein